MSIQLTNIFNSSEEEAFDSCYQLARDYFISELSFNQLSGKNVKDLEWSNKSGVYVIWDTVSNIKKVLYIGMTGKFSKDGELSVGKGLKGRIGRWTPYHFDRSNNTFNFNPRYTKGESRNKKPKNGYSQSIPVSNISISCFEYDSNLNMAPSFLEALLLQGFLSQFGCLPAANNKF